MAGSALAAEAPSVDIVARMAAGTALRKFTFAGRQPMAAGTASFAVCAGQREATCLPVIETLLAPGVGLVTISAAYAEISFVCVVNGMTRDTTTRRFFVRGRHMTSVTARCHMSTRQRIFGRIVIESSPAPIQLIVTLTAIVRERACVCIIILMAIPALARGVAPRNF